jgi:hypothetical protein
VCVVMLSLEFLQFPPLVCLPSTLALERIPGSIESNESIPTLLGNPDSLGSPIRPYSTVRTEAQHQSTNMKTTRKQSKKLAAKALLSLTRKLCSWNSYFRARGMYEVHEVRLCFLFWL